jgi:aspartate/methionine/tyrosine aminotransferase
MSIIESDVNEINFLDDIDEIEEEYVNRYGFPVQNISDWNSSKDFKNKMMNLLNDRISVSDLDYIFSYTINDTVVEKLLLKLGFSDTKKSILITHSGSASIFNTINLLKEKNIKKLYILSPGYFSVFHACNALKIKCIPLYIKRNKYYQIDYDEVLKHKQKGCAFWVTNPIYCTSVYYTDQDINFFQSLLDENIVVFDECLCKNEKELCRKLGNNKNFIGIYSPHKTICINSFKFSILVCDSGNQKYLDAWSDIICGCLNSSCNFAISHYLSNNFDIYSDIFFDYINTNFENLKKYCSKNKVDFDNNADGYLISMYFPYISANKGLDLNFIKTTLYKTGIRFIPGIRNHFDNTMGLNFRVNLSKIDKTMMTSIANLVEYYNEL